MEASLQNHFLVAMPALVDSFFHRAVVYLCEHDENGTMGLIINRPTRVMLDELLSHLNINNPSSHTRDIPVLFGGPVQKSQAIVLHNQPDPQWESNLKLSDTISLTTSADILEALGTDIGPNHALITLGYAGWGAGQLEQEISENSWLTVPAGESLLFDTPAAERWQAAARLIGVDITLMSDISGHA